MKIFSGQNFENIDLEISKVLTCDFDDDVSILNVFLNGTEPEMFSTHSVKKLLDWKWQKKAKFIHYALFLFHLNSMVALFIYIDKFSV